jgi:hypothetical protein
MVLININNQDLLTTPRNKHIIDIKNDILQRNMMIFVSSMEITPKNIISTLNRNIIPLSETLMYK